MQQQLRDNGVMVVQDFLGERIEVRHVGGPDGGFALVLGRSAEDRLRNAALVKSVYGMRDAVHAVVKLDDMGVWPKDAVMQGLAKDAREVLSGSGWLDE
jgi:hypothetical protein